MSDTALNYFVASGTAAEMAAFTPSPPTPAAGPDPAYYFYDTTNSKLNRWTGAAWAAITDPTAVGGNTTNNIGYLNIPQNSQSAAYTTVLADAGKHILHPTADNNPRTFTIDSNANVAYPLGTTITFVNLINTVTIAITSDTLILAGTGTTGSRTLAQWGVATALKITTTSWIISGTGLT